MSEPEATDFSRYHSPYTADSPYAKVVGLVQAHGAAGGTVLDLGCGYGAIAEPLRALGFGYVGLDLEGEGLEDLAHRGFAGHRVDLRDAGTLPARLSEALGAAPLAAVTALDIIEHLTNGAELLAAVRDFSVAHGSAPLVVSIPNVTHVDLAAKLVLGRWDVTPVGLLDITHVSLYSPARLSGDFAAAGWREVGADDFVLAESDQHFPRDAAAIAPTPLRQLIAHVREQAGPGAVTNQFARAFLPEPARLDRGAEPAASSCFLSIALLASAPERLGDVVLSLEAQRSFDFEVRVVLAGANREQAAELERQLDERSPALAGRLVVLAGPSERGAAVELARSGAKGRYFTVLDEASVVFPHYVESFARLAAERPGAVVRCLALRQSLGADGEVVGAAELCSRPRFLLSEHVFEPASPPGSYAIPASAFCDLGLSYAMATTGAEEEDVLLEAAMLCGVHERDGEIGLVRRRRDDEGPEGAGVASRQAMAARLDASPVLLPAGAVARFWEEREALRMARQAAVASPSPSAAEGSEAPEALRAELEAARAEAERLRAELAGARGELADLRSSTSWKLTAPLRDLATRRDRSGRRPSL
ncbi:MAG: hypothetical protein M0004_07215 [Actinomycetota bacterium]|nr:hypothetical protein [Actinomycetota bacterium]